jgi:hypothetical protein
LNKDAALNATEALFITAQFRLGTVAPLGTLRNRMVLAWAKVQVAEHSEEFYYVAREYVQPYNFSLESKACLSFVTPSRGGEGRIEGYVDVRISTIDGPEVYE